MSAIRKVQRTPSGTFFVCVPKSWAERCSLNRGSVIAIDETSDGKLLLDPRHGATPSQRTAILKPDLYLNREIIGKYLLGFDVIRVESKNGVSLEVRNIVKGAVNRLIGLEIVEEDYSNIALQCLLEPSGFPPEKILRRAYAIAAGMHRDVVNALIDGDLSLVKNVVARDDEINRLYFLLVRILRTIIQNPRLSEKLGVSPIDCLDYRLVASLVETIGDECVHMANKAMELEGLKLGGDIGRAFVDFHLACFGAHEIALNAFITGDVALAESVRGAREKMEKYFSNIEATAGSQSVEVVPHILAVASFLRQIYEHSVDIADLVVSRRD